MWGACKINPEGRACAMRRHSGRQRANGCSAGPSVRVRSRRAFRLNALTSPGADEAAFVRHFRSASAYVAGHRDSTVVIVVPGDVLQDKRVLVSFVDDVAMLHSMGIGIALVLGAAPQISHHVRKRGKQPKFVAGYRVTDEVSMEAAMEAAGSSRVLMEALMSKGPSVPMVRRHTRSDAEFHYAAAINVVSGNYTAARRRGVLDGVDFQYTGNVRFVDAKAIKVQLGARNIVLLSNLGYSSGGELLNCNTYDVAVHAAVEVGADKLICMHLEDVANMHLPEWLSLTAARNLLRELDTSSTLGPYLDDPEQVWPRKGRAGGASSAGQVPREGLEDETCEVPGEPSVLRAVRISRGSLRGQAVDAGADNGGGAPGRDGAVESSWQAASIPPAVMAAYEACRKGVKRSHLVDARLDGGLLLELYRQDGVGTMISADFYEGIRRARPNDVQAIKALLEPMERAGIVLARPEATLTQEVNTFVVIERETRVLACAQLRDLGGSENGQFTAVAEIAAFCVHPDFRGTGRGDSLLDWVEQDARCRGFDGLVLMTTRTADWFQARDFRRAGPAHDSSVLPADRRARIDAKRNSQLYMKRIEAAVPGMEPGTRIGF